MQPKEFFLFVNTAVVAATGGFNYTWMLVKGHGKATAHRCHAGI